MECWILDAGLCSCASSCCSTTSSSHNFAVFHFAHPSLSRMSWKPRQLQLCLCTSKSALRTNFGSRLSLCLAGFSTEDIIDATELNFLCEVRRCFAVCGRMHFQRFIREEIASGISIEIFSRPVREHECDPSASSWQDPYVPRMVRATSGRSLMQRAARQSRVASSAVVDPSAGVQDVTHPRLEAPAVTLRDLWQHHFAQCRDHDTDLLMVETWYLDHLRRPWSNEVRLTQLGR